MCTHFKRTSFPSSFSLLSSPLPAFLLPPFLLFLFSPPSPQFLSLMFDGLTGVFQDKLKAKHDVHSLHMMYAVNMYAAVYVAIGRCVWCVCVCVCVWSYRLAKKQSLPKISNY